MVKPRARWSTLIWFNGQNIVSRAIHMDSFNLEVETSPLRKLKFKPALVTGVYSFLRMFINYCWTWTHWVVQSNQNVLFLVSDFAQGVARSVNTNRKHAGSRNKVYQCREILDLVEVKNYFVDVPVPAWDSAWGGREPKSKKPAEKKRKGQKRY